MDNLPIPQSRIENLMNAFISRDSSRISAPQSRVEEFWYHLIEGTNSLPIPQSRIELLLKKIIENDTEQIPLAQSRAEEFLVSILTGDINKLPIPQSRSEYYLDYIARNNLVLDDIEYLKYNGTNITATNTVQKPFKSAILKGSTMVNLIDRDSIKNVGAIKVIDGIITWTDKVTGWVNGKIEIEPTISIVNGKIYTLIFKCNQERAIATGFIKGGTWQPGISIKTQVGVNTVKITSTATDTNFAIQFTENTGLEIYDIILLEGDYTNVDIPYFEGMQSVKMPVLTTVGKNLFNKDEPLSNYYVDTQGNKITGSKYDYINQNYFVRNNKSISISWSSIVNTPVNRPHVRISEYDKNSNFIKRSLISTEHTSFDFDSNTYYINICADNSTDNHAYFVDLQIEFSSTITSYEPYKSNILTVNEDVTMRSNGNVYDELDLLTGKLTQRIDEDGEVLTQEVVKTVDLKVVDQDGNQVKQLSAFDETTHIVSDSASDNSLIAIAEVEVPTKLIEALNAVKSLSSDVEMLINEVDNAQKLQDENSTMVMSAMTELYEMVLVMGGGS